MIVGIRILRLQNPYRHTHSFNRPNITYCVRKKDKKVMEEMGKIISKRQSQTGIVYCFSKKDTEKVCEDLKIEVPSLKNKITFYHAEVSPAEKERRQHLWSQGYEPSNDYVLTLTFCERITCIAEISRSYVLLLLLAWVSK